MRVHVLMAFHRQLKIMKALRTLDSTCVFGLRICPNLAGILRVASIGWDVRPLLWICQPRHRPYNELTLRSVPTKISQTHIGLVPSLTSAPRNAAPDIRGNNKKGKVNPKQACIDANLNELVFKAATLARVRDNQRRCRTRRREYIADLERKLQDYEAGKDPAEVGVRSTIEHLEQENKRLRALLAAAGLPRVWMEAYLKLGGGGGNGTKSGHPPLREGIPYTEASLANASQAFSVSGEVHMLSSDAITDPPKAGRSDTWRYQRRYASCR